MIISLLMKNMYSIKVAINANAIIVYLKFLVESRSVKECAFLLLAIDL